MAGYLDSVGWWGSLIKKRPVDFYGHAIPWYCYGATHFLEKRINSKLIVFEYGSGYSSLWWQKRVRHYEAVEHDVDWFDRVCLWIPESPLYFRPNRIEYAEQLSSIAAEFDIVIIDGIELEECLKEAIHYLSEIGVIILNQSKGRSEYLKAEEINNFLLFNPEFKEIEFKGLAPTLEATFETSIFYRNHNCLKI